MNKRKACVWSGGKIESNAQSDKKRKKIDYMADDEEKVDSLTNQKVWELSKGLLAPTCKVTTKDGHEIYISAEHVAKQSSILRIALEYEKGKNPTADTLVLDLSDTPDATDGQAVYAAMKLIDEACGRGMILAPDWCVSLLSVECKCSAARLLRRWDAEHCMDKRTLVECLDAMDCEQPNMEQVLLVLETMRHVGWSIKSMMQPVFTSRVRQMLRQWIANICQMGSKTPAWSQMGEWSHEDRVAMFNLIADYNVTTDPQEHLLDEIMDDIQPPDDGGFGTR